MSISAGLITFNALRNPTWFKIVARPMPLLALLILYSAFYNDRAAFGGISAGYLAFLAAL